MKLTDERIKEIIEANAHRALVGDDLIAFDIGALLIELLWARALIDWIKTTPTESWGILLQKVNERRNDETHGQTPANPGQAGEGKCCRR